MKIYLLYQYNLHGFADIDNNLSSGKLLPHFSPREKRQIIKQIARYFWIRGDFFYTRNDLIIRRCIREDPILDILKACHDEPCDSHFAYKRTTYKVLRLRYNWPTLFRDTKKYVRSCDSFQRMGKPVARDEMPIQPQVFVEPFEKWDVYFVRPIDPPSQGKRYILVCTDYVTKWVKVNALSRATGQSIVNFLFEDIFTRFGVPREIVTNQGARFTSKLVRGIVEKYKIKHRRSSPYHPQANGQVESTNKIIEAIMTKTIKLHRKDWPDNILEALWSYHITWKNTTGFNPYEMVYGKQILLPFEFKISTYRLLVELGMDQNEAQQQKMMQLNELDEVRHDSL